MTSRILFFMAVALVASRLCASETASAPPAAAAVTPEPEKASPAAPAPVRNAQKGGGRRADATVAPAAGFEAFRSIGERNIFNPNRTGPRRDRTEEARPRVDIISVVGTMESERGLIALFDGSSPGYRKTLRVGDSIEQFKLTRIQRYTVDLERDGKTFSLRVGQQLRRPEGADWAVLSEDIARAEAQTQARAAAAAPTISAPVNEIEARMRRNREQSTRN